MDFGFCHTRGDRPSWEDAERTAHIDQKILLELRSLLEGFSPSHSENGQEGGFHEHCRWKDHTYRNHHEVDLSVRIHHTSSFVKDHKVLNLLLEAQGVYVDDQSEKTLDLDCVAIHRHEHFLLRQARYFSG